MRVNCCSKSDGNRAINALVPSSDSTFAGICFVIYLLQAWGVCYDRVPYLATQLHYDMLHCGAPPGLQQIGLLPYSAYQSRPYLVVTVSNVSSLSSRKCIFLPETFVVVL